MNILLIYNHYAVSSGRYMTDAFKRLGHDVRHIGPAHGRSIWGMDVAERYVWMPDDLADASFDWKPDLVIIMDSDPRILDEADQYSNVAPVVVYGVDNHVRDYRRPWFEHYFLAHRGVSMMAWEYNTGVHPEPSRILQYPNLTWLPCAYDPMLFTSSPIPYAEREFDVCMIGVMYPRRWQLVNELRAAGLKVLAGTGLLFEDYRDAYHNARISLCVSAAGDVAQRVFETAAMGCAVASDYCPDFKLLKPEGIFIKQMDGLVEEVIKMSRASGVDGAAEFSKAWVRPHTWDARAQTIIDWLQKRQAGETAHVTE